VQGSLQSVAAAEITEEKYKKKEKYITLLPPTNQKKLFSKKLFFQNALKNDFFSCFLLLTSSYLYQNGFMHINMFKILFSLTFIIHTICVRQRGSDERYTVGYASRRELK